MKKWGQIRGFGQRAAPVPEFAKKAARDSLRNHLSMARNALAADRPAEAERWLDRALGISHDDPQVWYLLARCTKDPDERRRRLDTLLALDPHHAGGRRELALLNGLIHQDEILPEGHSGVTPRSGEAAPGRIRRFVCDSCGGPQRHDPNSNLLRCEHCGESAPLEQRCAADDEQPLDLVLPTTRGHRWSEASHVVGCEQCGAESLLPPSQIADRCPFCGSETVLDVPDGAGLLDPQAIAPMRVSAEDARLRARYWLSHHVGTAARPFPLRPLYLPMWTFDATYRMEWNDGQADTTRHTSRRAVYFDDVLVSGSSRMTSELVALLPPFDLKSVVAFDPAFLAGWPTLLYDRPLADASVEARGEMVRRARARLGGSATRAGVGRFVDMTFKQLLLPLWIGEYAIGEQRHRLLVNGQSGAIGGEQPRNESSGRMQRDAGLLDRLWRWLTG